MSRQKKIVNTVIGTMLGLGLLGVGTLASAQGFFGEWDSDKVVERQQAMFLKHATLLGVDVETVKTGWASGKNLMDLAEELGVNQDTLRERMQTARQSEMQSMLNSLVEKGVITQAQATNRLESIKNHEGRFGEGFGVGHGARRRGRF